MVIKPTNPRSGALMAATVLGLAGAFDYRDGEPYGREFTIRNPEQGYGINSYWDDHHPRPRVRSRSGKDRTQIKKRRKQKHRHK